MPTCPMFLEQLTPTTSDAAVLKDDRHSRTCSLFVPCLASFSLHGRLVAATSGQSRVSTIRIHARDYDRWLDREETEQLPLDLLKPYESEEMEMYEANPKVGPEMLNRHSTRRSLELTPLIPLTRFSYDLARVLVVRLPINFVSLNGLHPSTPGTRSGQPPPV